MHPEKAKYIRYTKDGKLVHLTHNHTNLARVRSEVGGAGFSIVEGFGVHNPDGSISFSADYPKKEPPLPSDDTTQHGEDEVNDETEPDYGIGDPQGDEESFSE